VISNGSGDGAAQLRWAGQRLDAATPGALPGLEKAAAFQLPGLVQSIRTPEFQGMTFHEVLSKSALNHVPPTAKVLPGEWTINPYRGCSHACVYCYARPTHEHLGMGLGTDFETQIVVKTNIVDVLRHELTHRREIPERVALGTNTDPYQRAEGRYRLMPGIIDALADARVDFSILTKGSLIRRDLDRLVAANERVDVQLGMSIAVVDDELQHLMEPGTPSASARLATVRAIRDAGLDCTVFAAPLLPGLTDSSEQIDELMAALVDAGATVVLPHLLYLQPGVKELYFDWIDRERPHLSRGYRRIYAGGTYAERGYHDAFWSRVRASILRAGLPVPDDAAHDRFALRGRRTRSAEPAVAPPTLF
jgi:DNA repair photolyase